MIVPADTENGCTMFFSFESNASSSSKHSSRQWMQLNLIVVGAMHRRSEPHADIIWWPVQHIGESSNIVCRHVLLRFHPTRYPQHLFLFMRKQKQTMKWFYWFSYAVISPITIRFILFNIFIAVSRIPSLHFNRLRSAYFMMILALRRIDLLELDFVWILNASVIWMYWINIFSSKEGLICARRQNAINWILIL